MTDAAMRRRRFLGGCAAAGIAAAGRASAAQAPLVADPDLRAEWTRRWEQFILHSARDRRCDTETGEEIGWLISPYLSGFYYGYVATRDEKWIGMLADWADAWIARAVKEPDGFPGWPKANSDGHPGGFFGDSLLGEAMALRPVAKMSALILRTPALERRWGSKARGYLELCGRVFDKWDSRGCWRETANGGLWVEAPFGIDRESGHWTGGYAHRSSGGFSHPANKENAIAEWMLAMFDVTGRTVYRDRAAAWFRIMRSRMKLRDDKYFVWNYWDPAGSWDYKPDGSTKHWVGVHPNGGYYAIDAGAIVSAFEHGLVFSRVDMNRLIATNRDFMWNREVRGARFQRIDGGPADPRWKNSPGVLWSALAPYDSTLREIFLSNHNPASWGGMSSTPWALSQSVAARA